MSRSTVTAQPASSPTQGNGGNYQLRSDVAQFCLPGATKDASQKLAYVNSICIFTLAIGFIGIKAPQLVNREPVPTTEMVPVDIVQIEPRKPPEPEPIPDTEPPPDTPVDMPQIATVVAADPSQVKFAIPVEGPVVFAPARFAEAPPADPPKATPPGPTKFDPNAERGSFPKLNVYPRLALQQQIQGTVTLEVIVDTNGIPSSVEVKESSGSQLLDRPAAQWIKTKYRWQPGAPRHFLIPVEFKLQ
jgi:protein TonB